MEFNDLNKVTGRIQEWFLDDISIILGRRMMPFRCHGAE